MLISATLKHCIVEIKNTNGGTQGLPKGDSSWAAIVMLNRAYGARIQSKTASKIISISAPTHPVGRKLLSGLPGGGLLLLLAACCGGGGGGGGGAKLVTASKPPLGIQQEESGSTAIEGDLHDPPIQNAKIYLDVNFSGQVDAGDVLVDPETDE